MDGERNEEAFDQEPEYQRPPWLQTTYDVIGTLILGMTIFFLSLMLKSVARLLRRNERVGGGDADPLGGAPRGILTPPPHRGTKGEGDSPSPTARADRRPRSRSPPLMPRPLDRSSLGSAYRGRASRRFFSVWNRAGRRSNATEQNELWFCFHPAEIPVISSHHSLRRNHLNFRPVHRRFSSRNCSNVNLRFMRNRWLPTPHSDFNFQSVNRHFSQFPSDNRTNFNLLQPLIRTRPGTNRANLNWLPQHLRIPARIPADLNMQPVNIQFPAINQADSNLQPSDHPVEPKTRAQINLERFEQRFPQRTLSQIYQRRFGIVPLHIPLKVFAPSQKVNRPSGVGDQGSPSDDHFLEASPPSSDIDQISSPGDLIDQCTSTKTLIGNAFLSSSGDFEMASKSTETLKDNHFPSPPGDCEMMASESTETLADNNFHSSSGDCEMGFQSNKTEPKSIHEVDDASHSSASGDYHQSSSSED